MKGGETVDICPACGFDRDSQILLLGQMLKIRIMCPCEEAEQKERERLRDERNAERSYRERLKGIPAGKYREYTFERDDRKNPDKSDLCKAYVKAWDRVKRCNKGLLFCGGVGSGKTFLACAIANEIVKVDSVMVSELPTLIRAIFNDDSVMDDIRRVGLLVIDDLGIERGTEYSNEQAYQIINERYKSNRPLIVTTNLTPQEMAGRGDTIQGRIYDRVLEMCQTTIIVTAETSRRIEGRKEAK